MSIVGTSSTADAHSTRAAVSSVRESGTVVEIGR